MPPQKVQKVEVSIYWSLYDFTTLKEVEEEDLWGVCFIIVEGLNIQQFCRCWEAKYRADLPGTLGLLC